MEGLSVSDANLAVYLHPSQSKNVSRSILRELSSLLFKYNEAFDGVVLAYGVSTPNKHARIFCGIQPYFSVRLKAKMLIFSPKPEMTLEGKVVRIARESVHVIVLGFSSAIITDEDICGEFKYKRKHGEGLFVSRLHKQHVIKVGTVIRFVVKSLDEEVLHMSGSLLPAHTGSVSWLDKNGEDHPPERSSKKRTETEGELETQEHGSAGVTQSFYSDGNYKDKTSKKRRIQDN